MRRWPTVGISVIVAVVLLTSCGPGRPTASVSSTTTVAPTTTTVPTTTVPYRGPRLTSIVSTSCADARHCWAGAVAGTDEGAILASTDGGATWVVQDVVPGVDAIGPIDCPTDTHCLAAGNRVDSNEPALLLSTTDGGTTWSTQPTASQTYALDAISCRNDSDCSVVAEEPQGFDLVMATTDWGGSWTVQERSSIEVSMGVGFGISCPSTSTCVVVGIGTLTTADSGSSWVKHPFSPGPSSPGSSPAELNDVSCPSIGLCVAQEDVTSAVRANTFTTIATSADGGASWHDVKTVEGQDLGSVSCPTTAVCVSPGAGLVEKSTDGGRSWTAVVVPQAYSLDDVSCATGTMDCVAVGADDEGSVGDVEHTVGVLLRSADGGSHWSSAPLPGT